MEHREKKRKRLFDLVNSIPSELYVALSSYLLPVEVILFSHTCRHVRNICIRNRLLLYELNDEYSFKYHLCMTDRETDTFNHSSGIVINLSLSNCAPNVIHSDINETQLSLEVF